MNPAKLILIILFRKENFLDIAHYLSALYTNVM